MSPERILLTVISGVLLAVTATSPAAFASWINAGVGSSSATAATLATPTGTANGSSCGNDKRHIDVTVNAGAATASLVVPAGAVLQIASPTTTSGGQSFASLATSGPATGAVSFDHTGITKGVTYYYATRMIKDNWISPVRELSGVCPGQQ